VETFQLPPYRLSSEDSIAIKVVISN